MAARTEDLAELISVKVVSKYLFEGMLRTSAWWAKDSSVKAIANKNITNAERIFLIASFDYQVRRESMKGIKFLN